VPNWRNSSLRRIFAELYRAARGRTRGHECAPKAWTGENRHYAGAFAERSACLADALEVSRFSCMLFLYVPGSSTTPRPALARDFVASADFAFLLSKQGRHAVRQLSGLNRPAHRCLCLRFAVRLATHHARLEVGIKSLLLFRRALSSPTTCRFIPAHLRPRKALSSVVAAPILTSNPRQRQCEQSRESSRQRAFSLPAARPALG